MGVQLLLDTIPDFSDYIDLQAALSRVRGNKRLYRKMLLLFLQSVEFEAFEQKLQTGDYAAASEVAHGIKGMTGNLSLAIVFETSSQLMVDLRGGMVDEALLSKYRSALETTREYAKLLCNELESEDA